MRRIPPSVRMREEVTALLGARIIIAFGPLVGWSGSTERDVGAPR
ncbi:MAG: hypothetical protein ACREQ7_20985 [Candidatus Binatia bacterium]